MTSPSQPVPVAERTPAPLMISVAGVRGIVGESLTPPVVCRFAAAFAQVLPEGPVVVGRDARVSGPAVYRAVSAGLKGASATLVRSKWSNLSSTLRLYPRLSHRLPVRSSSVLRLRESPRPT